jgi:phosphonate transport system substrate-binding protein
MRRFLIAGGIVAVIASVTGCTDQGRDHPHSRLSSRTSQNVVVIGLIPEQNVFRQMERYEPLAEYLSRRAGVEVRLKVLLRYGNIIQNFVSDGLDGAFFGSFTYALAHARLGVQAIARPVNLDGKSTYHGLIFVRKDSGIRTAEQMKGKRFVFVDKATTAGFLLPRAYFRKHEIDYRTFLREYYFAGTHENAILDVIERKADIGAAKNTVFEHSVGSDHRSTKDLVVLERSPDVPENALALRKDLDPRLVESIRSALLSMNNDPEGIEVLTSFGAQKFIATTDDDYRPVYQYVRDAGIDLATYDYLNE